MKGVAQDGYLFSINAHASAETIALSPRLPCNCFFFFMLCTSLPVLLFCCKLQRGPSSCVRACARNQSTDDYAQMCDGKRRSHAMGRETESKVV